MSEGHDLEDGPFGCSVPGCNKSFSNVDRLKVHTSVHTERSQENLNLKISRDGQMVDETPTPTRFIRNCDEVNLFDSLPKQNPFDEGFQAGIHKAMAAAETGDAINQFSNVETLAAVAIASAQASPSHSDDDIRAGDVAAAIHASTTSASSKYAASQANRFSGSFMNGDVVVPVPPPASLANPDASVPMAIPPTSFLPKTTSATSGTPTSVRPTKYGAAPDTKKRLQETLLRVTGQSAAGDQQARAATSARSNIGQQMDNRRDSLGAESSGSLDPDTHTVTIAFDGNSYNDDSSLSPPDDVTRRDATSTKRRRTTDEHDPAAKRARFLQRNREAATRCREKRKEWVAALEKKSQDLARENTRLLGEVNALRNERAHLKVLLLSHKDCPVTVEQQKQGKSLLPPTFHKPVENAAAPSGDHSEADLSGPATGSTAVSTSPPASSSANSASAVFAPVPSVVMPVANPVSQASSSASVSAGRGLAVALPGVNMAANSGSTGLTPMIMIPLTSDMQIINTATAAQNAGGMQPTQNVDANPKASVLSSSNGGPPTPSTAAIQALLGNIPIQLFSSAMQQMPGQPFMVPNAQMFGLQDIAAAAPSIPVMEDQVNDSDLN